MNYYRRSPLRAKCIKFKNKTFGLEAVTDVISLEQSVLIYKNNYFFWETVLLKNDFRSLLEESYVLFVFLS